MMNHDESIHDLQVKDGTIPQTKDSDPNPNHFSFYKSESESESALVGNSTSASASSHITMITAIIHNCMFSYISDMTK